MVLESLKQDIDAILNLGEMANMLEQIAAKEISQMKGRILESRPFFQEAWEIYRVLKQVAPQGPQVIKRDLVILITLNWGMSGNLLNRVIDRGERLYSQKQADLLITGRMGQQRFTDRDERTIHFFQVPNKVSYEQMEPLKKIVGQYARVHIVYPKYYRASKQEVEVVSLIVGETTEKGNDTLQVAPEQFLIEPDVPTVVSYLNQAIVGILLFNYFSESILAYNAAQMISMRNAHDNAKEEVARLMNQYHKARREMIDAKLREQHEYKFALKRRR